MLGKAGSAVKSIFEPKEKNFFKLNEDKVNALIRSVTGDLHNANYAALRKMDDVYRQTLFKAQMYYGNGAIGLEKAVDMATKDFLSKGIDCITYKNGRQVNIASYAEMSIRTANQRATLMGEGAKRDEYGVHTVCSAIHGNTCPLCLEWQGRVLIDDVYSGGSSKDGDYPLLSTAMGAGFLHPNCRHHPTTFFPGVNRVPTPLTEEEQAKALERYKAEQKQREIERDIRKWRRVEAGSLDPDNLAASTLRVDQLQAKMREHLGQHSYLRREPWREKYRGEKTNTYRPKQSGGKFTKGDINWCIRRDNEADDYYAKIRHRQDDIEKISKATGWSEKSITQIKDHVFNNEHLMRDGSVRRLDTDYNMAVAWQRLISGKHEDVDILLLKHEYLESIVEKKYNLSNLEAHRMAEKKHDWYKELINKKGEFGEDDCLDELVRKE